MNDRITARIAEVRANSMGASDITVILCKALEKAIEQRDRTLISLINSSRWSEYAAEYDAEIADLLDGKEGK